MRRVRLNNRVRKALHGRSRGFSLIEVVIAIALIALIGVAVLSSLSTASLALIIADKRATAESLARTQMESIKQQGYNSTYGKISVPGVTNPAGPYYICSCNSTAPNSPSMNCTSTDRIIAIAWNSTTDSAAIGETGLQKIRLVIKAGNETLVILEDYKRKPAT